MALISSDSLGAHNSSVQHASEMNVTTYDHYAGDVHRFATLIGIFVDIADWNEAHSRMRRWSSEYSTTKADPALPGTQLSSAEAAYPGKSGRMLISAAVGPRTVPWKRPLSFIW